MKKCKISVINAVIAGILICGMLAAFGVAEKRFAAPDADVSTDVIELNIPDNISSTRAKK